jgi:hypothetical protein
MNRKINIIILSNFLKNTSYQSDGYGRLVIALRLNNIKKQMYLSAFKKDLFNADETDSGSESG